MLIVAKSQYLIGKMIFSPISYEFYMPV